MAERTLADVDADLAAAYIARRIALTHKSFSMDSGQGRQATERQSLADIQAMIKDLEAEREVLAGAGSGMVYMSMER